MIGESKQNNPEVSLVLLPFFPLSLPFPGRIDCSFCGSALTPEAVLAWREYIVYDRRQCYPEYVVHYRRVPNPNAPSALRPEGAGLERENSGAPAPVLKEGAEAGPF